MPAYFDTGFSVREPMWHGLGTVLDSHPENWDEARLAAGLMWEPQARPLYHQPVTHADPFASRFEQVPNHNVVVRDDTQAVIGIVGDGYELVTHAAMGEIMEALSDEPNVKIETAGSCRGGSEVWALAYLDEPEQVAGDDGPTYPYLALLNAHDGTSACKIVNTSVRVVCWNTYQAASMEGQRTGRQFTFRHTASIHDRIEEAKAAIRGVRGEHARWVAMAEHLAALPASDLDVELFIQEFLPDPAEHPAGSSPTGCATTSPRTGRRCAASTTSHRPRPATAVRPSAWSTPPSSTWTTSAPTGPPTRTWVARCSAPSRSRPAS